MPATSGLGSGFAYISLDRPWSRSADLSPVQEVAMPARLERDPGVIDDLPTEPLETTRIPELGAIVVERLGPVGDGLDSVGSVDGGVTAQAGYATRP